MAISSRNRTRSKIITIKYKPLKVKIEDNGITGANIDEELVQKNNHSSDEELTIKTSSFETSSNSTTSSIPLNYIIKDAKTCNNQLMNDSEFKKLVFTQRYSNEQDDISNVLTNLFKYDSISDKNESVWFDESNHIVESLKSWRRLYKILDHKKRQLKKKKKSSNGSFQGNNNDKDHENENENGNSESTNEEKSVDSNTSTDEQTLNKSTNPNTIKLEKDMISEGNKKRKIESV